MKVLLMSLVLSSSAFAESLTLNAVDFFVIGDSQVSYHHHIGYIDFFGKMNLHCRNTPGFKSIKQGLFSSKGFAKSGAGLEEWLDPSGPKKKMGHGEICNLEDHQRFFGSVGSEVFQGVQYDSQLNIETFCKKGRTPLQGALTHNPRVVIANFLGNEPHKYDKIQENIDKFTSALPEAVSCVIVTSPPQFNFDRTPEDLKRKIIALKKRTGDANVFNEYSTWRAYRRSRALMVHRAVKKNGRCELVEGTDFKMQKTLANDIENYNIFTYSDDQNNIIVEADQYHLSRQGSLKFFDLKKNELCEAFTKALIRNRDIVHRENVKTSTAEEATAE